MKLSKQTFLSLAVLSFLAVYLYAEDPQNEAQKIYQENQKSVYQIRVVDLTTGKKSAIGSGFQISKEGHIVTNFHVISQAVNSPKLFRLEFVRHDGTVGDLEILNFDVIHDLAVVKCSDGYEPFLELGASDLLNGTQIFSMGNPLDLGMTIVEGIYNGLMQESLYRKILFSGSLNPGMSGGPALDRNGAVIGVNVSTAGNEVSFLVPVEYLKDLYDVTVSSQAVDKSQYKKIIEQQLLKNQDHYINSLLSSQWDVIPIGPAEVPGEIIDVFKCWGETHDLEQKLYNHSDVQCSSQDYIYLSDGFLTGRMQYQYRWITTSKLNTVRFYNLYEKHFDDQYWFENAGKEDVTNFKCETNFVQFNGADWKVGLCARKYKKYKSLYDISLSMAALKKKDQGLLIEVTALGLNKANAMKLVRKFMEETRWKE